MLASGTTLGRYEIVAPIGAGGMGEVYRARDTRLGRQVAVKVLPVAFSQDQERLHRFEGEARAAAGINHPNILVVHDVGTHAGAPYIVSELLEGETLRARLQSGPLSVRKAVDCAVQVCRGLAAAHGRGILHRDLKPENVFITRDGQVKILDFGLAKLTKPDRSAIDVTHTLDSAPGMVVGTLGYMSPEQVRGSPADTRSDLFAVGAILYEMLTGDRAFKGDTPADTLTAILTKEPPELANPERPIPAILESIVRHCLEKQPEERFQSAGDVGFALQQITASSSAAVEARPDKKGMWRLFVPAAFAIALALGGLVLGWIAHGPQPSPTFRQLTYRRGTVAAARFLADEHTVIYSAAWDGAPKRLYTTRTDLGGEISQGISGEVLSTSASGEMLVLRNEEPVYAYARIGELDRVPASGGGPRVITDQVQDAAWGPDGSIAAFRYVDQRYRLEYPLGKTLFETSGFGRAPRISPRNGQVAFLFHPILGDDFGSVATIDGQGHMRELTSRYASVNGLAWSRSGDELWFSATKTLGKGGGIFAVDMRGEVRTVLTTPDRVNLLDIAPSGRVLFANNREVVTTMLSGPELSTDRDMAVSLWTVPADISPDNKYVVLGDETTNPYTVVLAKSDGSPPVRLGQGAALAISPDGQWVLASGMDAPQQYFLLPTGAGEAKQITHDSINRMLAYWFPDSKRFLFNGSEPGHKIRAYVQDISGGAARPLTPEGVSGGPVSPDGTHFIARDETNSTFLQSFDNRSQPWKLKVNPSEHIRGWLDSRHVYLYTPPVVTDVYSLDVTTGKRELLKRIHIADPAGVENVVPVEFARDGKHFAYGLGRALSDLHEADGLR
jgi:eukaryotic-like serine/threonine-protein kinase